MAHKQYAEFTCDGPGCDESIKVEATPQGLAVPSHMQAEFDRWFSIQRADGIMRNFHRSQCGVNFLNTAAPIERPKLVPIDRGEPIDLEHLQRVAGMAPAEA